MRNITQKTFVLETRQLRLPEIFAVRKRDGKLLTCIARNRRLQNSMCKQKGRKCDSMFLRLEYYFFGT